GRGRLDRGSHLGDRDHHGTRLSARRTRLLTASLLPWSGWEDTEGTLYPIRRPSGHRLPAGGRPRRNAPPMRIAHFIQRYPPALGGSEAYFARLSRFLAAAGDDVTVHTTAALDLEAFWSAGSRCLPAGVRAEEGVEVRRYPLWRCAGRRYLLKALSFIPHRPWQCLTLPCNPIAPSMWSDTGRSDRPFDVVHATAFPYAWPIACGLR